MEDLFLLGRDHEADILCTNQCTVCMLGMLWYVMVCSKMVNVPKHEQLFQGFCGYPNFGENDAFLCV